MSDGPPWGGQPEDAQPEDARPDGALPQPQPQPAPYGQPVPPQWGAPQGQGWPGQGQGQWPGQGQGQWGQGQGQWGQGQWQGSPYQQIPPRKSSARGPILAGVGAALVMVLIIGALLFARSSATGSASAASASTTLASASASVAPAADCTQASSITDEPVGYHACGTAAKDVGVPTFDTVAAHKTYTATIQTNRGTIVFTADGKDAPYTVYSFVYLVQKSYFNNTTCDRLTTISEFYLLQCGDPTGTGSGGPGYAFQDENLSSLGSAGTGGTVTYRAGTVAMANAGPDTNGSQFFLVYRDSTIAPDYTPFGTVTQGLSVLTQIAAAGTNNSYSTGDGAPNESVQISQVQVSVQ